MIVRLRAIETLEYMLKYMPSLVIVCIILGYLVPQDKWLHTLTCFVLSFPADLNHPSGWPACWRRNLVVQQNWMYIPLWCDDPHFTTNRFGPSKIHVEIEYWEPQLYEEVPTLHRATALWYRLRKKYRIYSNQCTLNFHSFRIKVHLNVISYFYSKSEVKRERETNTMCLHGMGNLFTWEVIFCTDQVFLDLRSLLSMPQSHAYARAVTQASLIYMELLGIVAKVAFDVRYFPVLSP